MKSAERNVIKCPECGVDLYAGTKVCGFCGYELSKVDRCAECGAVLPEGSSVCGNCGCPVVSQATYYGLPQPVAQLTPVVAQMTSGVAAEPSGGLAICAMILCFLIPPVGLILGAVGIFVYKRGINRGLSIAAVSVGAALTIVLVILLCNIIPAVNKRLEEIQKVADGINSISQGVTGAADSVTEVADKIGAIVDVVKGLFS